MEIYFLRHANAGESKLNRTKDEQRPLDKLGIEQCHIVGRALAGLKIAPDAIISSPLLRARQTAEIVASQTGHEDQVIIDDAMRPEASYEQFEELLARHKDKDAIMLVGHNPSQTEFLNRLLTGGQGEPIDFKKAAVARVDVEPAKPAVLKWMIPPKAVKAIQASAKSSRPKTVSK